MSEPHQYAYKQFHTTEITLIKVPNDLLLAKDRSEVSILIHKILLEHLSTRFGFKDKALDRIKSYLSRRTQAVKIGEEHSESLSINVWCPTRICHGSTIII